MKQIRSVQNIPLLIKKHKGGVVDVCNTLDAHYYKGLCNNQGRIGVLVVIETDTDKICKTEKG